MDNTDEGTGVPEHRIDIVVLCDLDPWCDTRNAGGAAFGPRAEPGFAAKGIPRSAALLLREMWPLSKMRINEHVRAHKLKACLICLC